MDNISLCFSFSEFAPLAEHITQCLNQSATLQQCGLTARHIALASPKTENREHDAEYCRYLVCLFGQEINSKANKNDLRMIHKIESTLEAGADIFVFIIGSQSDDESPLPAELEQLNKYHPNRISFETVTSVDHDAIAQHIAHKIEDDIWQTLGEKGQLSHTLDLLHIPGFPRHQLKQLPTEIRKQLTLIYQPGDPRTAHSPDAANLAQRKRWAYQSLAYGHQDQAIKNLQKANNEFGSDLFSCFWLSRLFALYGTRTEHWQSSQQHAELLKKRLPEEASLLLSLNLTHLGRAYSFQQDYGNAEACFHQAIATYQTYESLEYLAEAYLMQGESGHNNEWREKAVDTLTSLLQLRLSHYVLTAERFIDKYPKAFSQVNHEITLKIDSFHHRAYMVLADNQSWSKQHLGLALPAFPPLSHDVTLLQRSYVASHYIWQNYRTLRMASSLLETRFHQYSKRQAEVNADKERHDKDYNLLTATLSEALACLKVRKEQFQEFSHAKTQGNLARRRLTQGNVVCIASIVAMGIGFGYSTELGTAGVFGVLLALGLREKLRRKRQSTAQKLHKIATHIKTINKSLEHSLEDAKGNIVQAKWKSMLSALLPDIEKIRSSDMADAEAQLNRSYESQTADFNKHLRVCHNELYLLGQLMREWLAKANNYEQHFISAYGGQYSHLTRQKSGFEITDKKILGSDRLEDTNATVSGRLLTGKAIHTDGDRLAAWFDNPQQAHALIALKDLDAPLTTLQESESAEIEPINESEESLTQNELT